MIKMMFQLYSILFFSTFALGRVPDLTEGQKSKQSAFLDVHLKIEPEDDFCGAKQCNISYGISVLAAQNQFDLQSLMLLDGSMKRHSSENKFKFEDSTVIRIARGFTASDTNIFLGIRLFDVPDDIQDYIVVDVTNVINKNTKARVKFESETVRVSVSVKKKTEDQLFSEYTRRLKTLEDERRKFDEMKEMLEENKCSCSHKNCACCEHMKIRKLHLDDSVCINITYISEDIGMRFSMSVDNHVYYSKEVSIRNPPPICYDVPHLREYASICIEFYNMELKNKHLDGCIRLEANLYHVKIARKQLACFKIPV